MGHKRYWNDAYWMPEQGDSLTLTCSNWIGPDPQNAAVSITYSYEDTGQQAIACSVEDILNGQSVCVDVPCRSSSYYLVIQVALPVELEDDDDIWIYLAHAISTKKGRPLVLKIDSNGGTNESGDVVAIGTIEFARRTHQ